MRSKFRGNGREENYSKRTAGEQTVNIQVHLNKLECHGKVHLFQ